MLAMTTSLIYYRRRGPCTGTRSDRRGDHNPARCNNTCVYLDRQCAARLAGRGDEILPREGGRREGVARAGRDAYRRDGCQALDGRVCFYVDDVVVALRAVD